jgi:hypothetical protein
MRKLRQHERVQLRTLTDIGEIESMTPIFRWNGEYVGFIHNGTLFDSSSRYLGWIDEGHAWKADGRYLGQLTEDNYILRNVMLLPPMPRMPPLPPMPPMPPMNRMGRMPRVGWMDALDS